MSLAPALVVRVWELAGDVGRLRRRVEPGSSLEHLCDRLSSNVAAIDIMLRPTAAELVAWNAPGDEEAIAEALRLVDDHWRLLQTRLGMKPS